MSDILKIGDNVDDGLREFLRSLLESGYASGVFGLRNIADDAVSYSLITDPELLESLLPFYPLMPTQGGKALSRLLITEPFGERVVALLRPCELRAFIELVKRKQGSMENLLIISCICPGVYPLSASLESGFEGAVGKYQDAVDRGEIPEGIRSSCASCVEFTPSMADMTVVYIGDQGAAGSGEILLNTSRAKEVAQQTGRETSAGSVENRAIDTVLGKRRENRVALFEEARVNHLGLENLLEVFGRCLGCHGCREICPICYCDLCEFDSQRSDLTVDGLDAALGKRGGLRAPTGTIAFHAGRLMHMAYSCVACGQCTDVCPVDIPVSTIFSKVGQGVQEMFDYIPGRNLEESMPLATFRVEEFSEVED